MENSYLPNQIKLINTQRKYFIIINNTFSKPINIKLFEINSEYVFPIKLYFLFYSRIINYNCKSKLNLDKT